MHLNDLAPASFRGARFLVPRDKWEEGRNSIKHEYPDKEFRYNEDNGAIPADFDITAILHGPNVRGQVSKLRAALMRPGPGVLKHPHFGAQFVTVMGPYQGERTDRELGVVKLDIKFSVTGPPSLPRASGAIPAMVSALSANVLRGMFKSFVEEFETPLGARSRELLVDGVTAATEPLRLYIPSTPATLLARDTDILFDAPETLGELLLGAYRNPFEDESLSNATIWRGYDAADLATEGLETLATATEKAIIRGPTPDLTARKVTAEQFARTLRAAALVAMAEAAVGRTYTTADEVSGVKSRLLRALSRFSESGAAGDVLAGVADIVNRAVEVLNGLELQLPRIDRMSVAGWPVSALAYHLYEDDGRISTLVGLNPGQIPVHFDERVNVLVDQAA